ncbi:MAG: efflux RND transporter permease subunit [Proteobacteria bacterium]|nr:efflux RND transporter permease subunit [Pseudomonadota bacterium]
MSLAEFSIRRPIFTTMIALIVGTFGVVSLLRLQIDMLPEIEMPRLSVRVSYEGASPEVMERLVTQPVEEIISTVPGIEEITSESSEGRSWVSVTFVWGTDIDVAAQDVRARLEDELDELPEEVDRPQIRKFDIASFPVVLVGVASKLDPIELTEIVDRQIRYRFARIPGVAQVDPWGGYDREIRVELDADRIKALSLPLDQVISAIRDANLDRPAGEIDVDQHEVTLRAPAEYQSLDDIRTTVVAVRDGAPVTLGSIATVRDTYERLSRIVRVNGELGLRLAIRKQAHANTVDVSKRVLQEIARINADYPQIQLYAVINQGNFIERSIANVARSVIYGGGLAILVLLLFLRSTRSTVVIGVAIPLSIVATLALMYGTGLTLNLMTLGGLALGVGMIVDSSIVVLENTFRRRAEERESPERAAIAGTREVRSAIVASTITTLVIFLPLMFIQGVSGLLFRELAFVVSFSLICALLVALSLLPMLAAKFIPEHESQENGRWASWMSAAERAMTRAESAYQRLLGVCLQRRPQVIAIAAITTLGSFLLVSQLGSEFIPPSDEGQVRVVGEMDIAQRLELVDAQTKKMEAIVYPAVPEAIATVVTVGVGFRGDGVVRGTIRLSLAAASQRERSNQEIAADLRKRLETAVPGMKIRTRAPQGQFLLERVLPSAAEGIVVEVRGFEMERLEALAERVGAAIQHIDGVTDVETSRKAGVPQLVLRIDRGKAAQLGLSVRDVATVLETAVAGRMAGEYRPEGHSYRIFVQLKEVRDMAIDDILAMTVSTPNGGTVPLRTVLAVDSGRGPVLIDRKDQQRLITVTANVADRDLGSVAADVAARLSEIPRPLGYDLIIGGSFEEQEESARQLLLSLLLALVLVYMVLACQYESLRDPLVVMMSVPAASVGVIVTLWATGTTLNVQSYIGCIMLGGIVVNNAILLVDQASQLVGRGASTVEAVVEAGRRRLRPILMTTLTTVLGLLPLAFGIGEGAEAQAPLARAVIGGLIGSTLITLILIPAVYTLFHSESATHQT